MLVGKIRIFRSIYSLILVLYSNSKNYICFIIPVLIKLNNFQVWLTRVFLENMGYIYIKKYNFTILSYLSLIIGVTLILS